MKNKIQLLVLTLLAVTLSSCYNYQSLLLLQEKKSLPIYEKSEYVDYRIRVNDEIIYRLVSAEDKTFSKLVSSNSSNSASGQSQISYRVYTDGTIDLPFISRIPVVGLTINEATKVI